MSLDTVIGVRTLFGISGILKDLQSQLCAIRARPRVSARKRPIHTCRYCRDPNEIVTSPDIDAVAVITPVWTHFELAKAALENGKHVFVEKPFTSTVAQSEELIELAERKNLKIMVDHTFLFTGAVQKDPAAARRRNARDSSTTTIPHE